MRTELSPYRSEYPVALRIFTNRLLGECQLSIVEGTSTGEHLLQRFTKFGTNIIVISHIAVISLFQAGLQRLATLTLQSVKKGII